MKTRGLVSLIDNPDKYHKLSIESIVCLQTQVCVVSTWKRTPCLLFDLSCLSHHLQNVHFFVLFFDHSVPYGLGCVSCATGGNVFDRAKESVRY